MPTIEVFADAACAYTHVGLRRFVTRRDLAGRADLALWVRAWPLELVNGTPLPSAKVAGQVAVLRTDAAPDLFTGFTQETYPATSLPALELTAAGYRVDSAVGERVALALRDALFEQGRDISDATVLSELANTHGVAWTPGREAQAVRADWQEGQTRGVLGSPHFFVGEASFFCPSLDIERVDGALQVSFDVSAFEAFMDTCLQFQG